MGGADDGVATNTNSGGETNVGQFVHQLVGQGTGLGNQTNLALAGDVRRDNADQALLGEMMPGQLGPMMRVICLPFSSTDALAAAQNSAES